ncbi:glycoside hydrolase domain-containing protein [Streptomyces sp. NPDC049040]|uniref:glycoside hydrolase domain-containing protein n=1 Tax=Streptomyces sp. NPDC049040 TaxID=3365593 RepID=UPI00371945B9
MSKRRLPKPRWQRYAGIAAAVVVIGGGAAFAAAAAGGGGKNDGTTARTDAAGVAGALQSGASPSAQASGSAKPGASASSSARVSASASGTATASAGASPSESGKGGGSAKATTSSDGSAKPATVAGPPHSASVKVFTGLAFDTCTAPSASKMSAWKASSPYSGAAVYIGGRNRGCSQPSLTSSWVGTTTAAGWKLIPIYVGAQPPCQSGSSSERIGASDAASLGASDGADAVGRAKALGMGGGSAVYLDMEAFDASDTACVDSVLTYVQAWDKALHARGYWAGFYGFSSSSAAVVAKADPTVPDMPDALWYARYDGNNSTVTGFPFSSGLWTGHRRGHQYQVNSKETYGGASITVDRDAWDGPVAVVG